MAKSRKKYHVFLSHNSVDKPWVNRLKDALEQRRLKVWLDQYEIRPGDLFVDALEKGLESCRAVALIVSPEAMQSGWVKEEYNRAVTLAQNKMESLRLIPVILRLAELPGFLSGRNWVDFTDEASFNEAVEKLIWGITGRKPHNISSAPLPQQPDDSIGISEVSTELTATPSSGLIQAHHIQSEQQPPVNAPGSHQPHSGHLSSRELLVLARSHIKAARVAVQTTVKPFSGKGNILPAHFTQAIELLDATVEHMRNLLELLPIFLSLSPEPVITRITESHWEMEVEMYRVREEAEKSKTLFQRSVDGSRQGLSLKADALYSIMQRASRIEMILNKLSWYFEDDDSTPGSDGRKHE